MNQADTYRARLWGERDAGVDVLDNPFEELLAVVAEEPADEMLYLDFKSGCSLFPSGKLDRDAVKRILSKAVSAFANASGGVLVWGVRDWEKTPTKRPELEVFPAAQADELHRTLKRIHHGATQPPPPDVRHTLIPGGEKQKDCAYVATYVGKNEGPPLQVRYGKGEGRFYRRRSDGSSIMSCDEIGDMFGRRPQPRLELDLHYGSMGGTTDTTMEFFIRVGVRNDGRGLARYPSLFLGFERSDRYEPCQLPALRGQPQQVRPVLPQSHDHLHCYAGVGDAVIHPGTVLPFMKIRVLAHVERIKHSRHITRFMVPPLVLNAKIFAAGMPPKTVERTVDADEMKKALGPENVLPAAETE